MSDLRQHLDAARSQYLAASYPGNLAAEILRPAATRSGTGWRVVLAGATAAAAMIAVAFWLSSRTPIIPGNQQAFDQSDQTQEVALIDAPSIDLSGLSDQATIVPPAMDISFSMPAITFATDESSSSSPTTREAV
ncbi:MAG TPA: hypothetical protein VH518_19895 [Tepidisphaeraceae bacterium]